ALGLALTVNARATDTQTRVQIQTIHVLHQALLNPVSSRQTAVIGRSVTPACNIDEGAKVSLQQKTEKRYRDFRITLVKIAPFTAFRAGQQLIRTFRYV